AGAAPGTLSGSFNLSGNALLQFGSGSLTGIASGSQVSLSGAQAQINDSGGSGSNSALTGLASNAGTLTIANGVSLSTTNGTDFSNTGTVNVDNPGSGGSRLNLGGALTNGGSFNIGGPSNPNSISAPVAVTATGLNNTGSINVRGSNASPFVQ